MRYVTQARKSQNGSLSAIQVVFVDVMDSIIEKLQATKSYTVTEIGGEGEKVNTITNYRAINSKTHEADVIKEIASADLVCPVNPEIVQEALHTLWHTLTLHR